MALSRSARLAALTTAAASFLVLGASSAPTPGARPLAPAPRSTPTRGKARARTAAPGALASDAAPAADGRARVAHHYDAIAVAAVNGPTATVVSW